MEQSERYIKMKKGGATEEDIQKAFNTPQEMTVFSYHGEVDTIMTPMDSIRYYKSFLRAGFMCMDTRTGYVKAYGRTGLPLFPIRHGRSGPPSGRVYYQALPLYAGHGERHVALRPCAERTTDVYRGRQALDTPQRQPLLIREKWLR